MNTFAHIVLIAFAPLAGCLFRVLSLQWALAVTVVGGHLYLPVLKIPLTGLPDYTKSMAISAALLLGLLIRAESLPRQQPLRWWDALFLTWILSLPISYLANGYPAYNAFSALFDRMMIWGAPYWIGRAAFPSTASIGILLRCLVLGSLTYIPLALWEIRMSPQLHTQIYGAFQHTFLQTIRWGGFRPIVFMAHPLHLALWFAITLLAAIRLKKHLSGVPAWYKRAWWLAPGFALMLLLCKSLGPLALGLTAAASLSIRSCRSLLALAIIAGATYLLGRIFFDEAVYQWVLPWLDYLPADRAQSIQFRMDNERLLLARAWEQPFFGFVKEGFRTITVDGEVQNRVVADSLWIVAFGTTGLLGLISLYGTMLTAAVRGHFHKDRYARDEIQILSTIVAVLALDTIANGQPSPFAIVCMGAVLGHSTKPSPNPLACGPATKASRASNRLRPRHRPATSS